MKPNFRDKQVQVLLTNYLSPYEHFEEVMFALKGMGYDEGILLEWMEKDGYDQRARHDEKEKLTRYRSAQSRATAIDGAHVRGFSTLKQLYLEQGGDLLDLQIEASQLDDEDVEYISNDSSSSRIEREQKRAVVYKKQDVEPAKKLPDLFCQLPLDKQYQLYLKLLFRKGEQVFGTRDPRSGGQSVLVDTLLTDPVHKPNLININPCNGLNGNDNVTVFRHTLVECDDIEGLEMQYALLLHSGLPITCITDSAGKSLHAAIKVDAKDYEEYSERVNLIKEFCTGIGINYDSRCRDPSRYSRCAGAIRVLDKPVAWRSRQAYSEHPQHLIDVDSKGSDLNYVNLSPQETNLVYNLLIELKGLRLSEKKLKEQSLETRRTHVLLPRLPEGEEYRIDVAGPDFKDVPDLITQLKAHLYDASKDPTEDLKVTFSKAETIKLLEILETK